jgi:hypothetical protein
MLAAPWWRRVANPVEVMVTFRALLDDQITDDEMSNEVPFEYVPVAVYCEDEPTGKVARAGVTAMELKVAAFTVSVVVLVIAPTVARIVLLPWAILEARPLDEIVATPVLLEVQEAEAVKSCVLPSEKVPVAVNCCITPTGMEGFAGVMAMDTRTAEVTVMVVLALLPPKLAVIVEVPTLAAVARPVLLMVAALLLEVQLVVE